MHWRYVIYIALFAFAVLIQWPLWLGKGGIVRMRELQTDVASIHAANDKLRDANGMIATEIESLESGTDAVLEHARLRLGMIRSDEVLFRFVPEGTRESLGVSKNATLAPPGRLFQPKHDNLYLPGDQTSRFESFSVGRRAAKSTGKTSKMTPKKPAP